MKYLLDTNVISEVVARQPNDRVISWLDNMDPGSIYLSVITIGEIRKGIERLGPSKRQDALLEWLVSDLLLRFHGHIAEITTEVMLLWGQLAGRLENQGKPMGAIDSLIAAIALEGNYVLVTRNDKDFEHSGVALLNPWD